MIPTENAGIHWSTAVCGIFRGREYMVWYGPRRQQLHKAPPVTVSHPIPHRSAPLLRWLRRRLDGDRTLDGRTSCNAPRYSTAAGTHQADRSSPGGDGGLVTHPHEREQLPGAEIPTPSTKGRRDRQPVKYQWFLPLNKKDTTLYGVASNEDWREPTAVMIGAGA